MTIGDTEFEGPAPFYKETSKIEAGEDISLDFKILSDQVLLNVLDLENVDLEDLSPANQQRKLALNLNRHLLPDCANQRLPPAYPYHVRGRRD